MNKLIGWLLIALAVVVVIAMFVANDSLWAMVNILEIVLGLWAGIVLLRKA